MSGPYLTQSSRIAARKLGGEMVIMSVDDSSLYILNEVATAIWEAADGRTPLSEIIERVVCAQFDVDPAQARQDAEEFIAALSQHKILVIADRPMETRPTPTANLLPRRQEA